MIHSAYKNGNSIHVWNAISDKFLESPLPAKLDLEETLFLKGGKDSSVFGASDFGSSSDHWL